MAERARAWVVATKETVRRAIYWIDRVRVKAIPASGRNERDHYRHIERSLGFGAEIEPSPLRLDVAYVLAEKDLPVLQASLNSVREFLRHPMETVHVVSARSDKIEAFCREQGCRWTDERALMGFGPDRIKLHIGGENRSGWLYQQLIKLSLDALSPSHAVYVLDADTVLASPQVFTRGARTLMLVSDERHQPYRFAYARLLRQAPSKDFSFVAHQMVFDPARLAQLRARIEALHPGRQWWEAILDSYEPGAMSGFSEFETYGNWMAQSHPEEVAYEYWANRRLPRAWLDRRDGYVARWRGRVRSISFHAHGY